MNTKLLVQDYTKYRLEMKGLHWVGAPALPEPSPAQMTMRTLGVEFEERYTEVFQDMSNQIHVTPNTAHPTFTAIVNELFSDGIKWGRIVALFSFGGSLAVHCIEKEMPLLVDQIVDWVTQYVDTNLASWITQHGGWVSTHFKCTFIHFFSYTTVFIAVSCRIFSQQDFFESCEISKIAF